VNDPEAVFADLTLQVAADADWVPSVGEVGAWADAAVRASSAAPDRQVSATVRLVSEEESKTLNERFRGIQSATNVLAFPAGEAVLPAEAATTELGDLAICLAVVNREAAEQAKELQSHLAHMVIHGMLHLLGYDHIDDTDAMRMEACEQDAMQSLGFPDPYAGDG